MYRFTLWVVGIALLAGCATETSRIRGQVLDNGQPLKLPGGSIPQSVVFVPIGPDGNADSGRMYSALISPDGTFELVAAGGSVPPGMYRVSLDITIPGKAGEQFKPFAGAGSPLRRELKPGSNDLIIDLSKPQS